MNYNSNHHSPEDRERDERRERKAAKRFRFDGTVTLGNVLTMVGMMGTILMLWRNMETRVLIVEERVSVQGKSLEKLVESVERLAAAQAEITIYNNRRPQN